MTFASRQDAGHRLGVHLQVQGVETDLVLGLPRGGVVVAAEVARVLGCPLDVLVVRKIGHPLHREFAVGALAEHGVVLLNESAIGTGETARQQLQDVIDEETGRLRHYESVFHENHHPELTDKRVILVDDGLATGATTEAAILSARRQGARHVCVAVPVSSVEAAERLLRLADDVMALWVDPNFEAVGCCYEDFPQITDEQVIELLRGSEGRNPC